LEKGFEEFKSYFKDEDFGKAQFLNISINLNEILIKEINTFLAEYKNIALGQIEFLNEKAQYNLDELFSFSNMKSKINNEINNYYNTILLPILKREAIYTYEDDHVSHYDFSSAIINDIDTFITKEIKKAKEIMKIMEGKQYELNETFSYDFSNVKKDIVNDIKNKFGNFISNQLKKDQKDPSEPRRHRPGTRSFSGQEKLQGHVLLVELFQKIQLEDSILKCTLFMQVQSLVTIMEQLL